MQRLVGGQVAANLKAIRQKRGLSYAELARRLRARGHPIADTGLMKTEKGSRSVDVDDLVALAAVLEVAPNRLLLPPATAERASYEHELAPGVKGTPLVLWAWATGEAPLGHHPSVARDDRSARGEEVVFSRENRPHHWMPMPVDAPPDTKSQAFARVALMAMLVEAFRAGLSTADIRTTVEAALIASLSSPEPLAGKTKMEVGDDGRMILHLNYEEGDPLERGPGISVVEGPLS